MFDRNNSLLPATATDLAKALDILEERLFDLPVQMITKDPQWADPGLLDHLAWEHSVDVWDPTWPESIKRDVIAISAEVHRFKGTPYAIKAALSVFDVDTDLLEWWEPEGITDGLQPGSFRVTAYVDRSLYGANESSVSTAMVHALSSVVQRAAPVSRKLIFRLAERFNLSTTAKPGLRHRMLHKDVFSPQPRTQQLTSDFELKAGLRHRVSFSQMLTPQPRRHRACSNLTLKSGLRSQLRHQSTHNVIPREGAAYVR